MAFTQEKIDRASTQSRSIFNNYVYRTTDTLIQVKAPGYFAACRFATSDGPDTNGFGWNGGNIECYCSDGYMVGQMDAATGTIAALFQAPTFLAQGDILNSSSFTTQIPVTLGTTLQVSFGGAVSTTKFDLAANGALTCKETGQYRFVFSAQPGREGVAGIVNLFLRLLKNGSQVGNTSLARMDNANTVIPLRFIVNIDLVKDDVLTAEMVQDPSGIAGAGGLYSIVPATAGWAASPAAAIAISHVTVAV